VERFEVVKVQRPPETVQVVRSVQEEEPGSCMYTVREVPSEEETGMEMVTGEERDTEDDGRPNWSAPSEVWSEGRFAVLTVVVATT
jgi:hypothetical protein